ncbi:active breakpoint cluster region-related protein [Aplochiton taeniatus]
METNHEAVKYLPSVLVPVEAEVDVLEEDVFREDSVGDLLSPLQNESVDIPDTPTSPEELLERRLLVLRGILDNEELYLSELETLLTPMKALQASAGTSQPVLSSQQVKTIFYQVPELRDLHRDFYSALRARLGPHTKLSSRSGSESDQGPRVPSVANKSSGSDSGLKVEPEVKQWGFQLTVGDLFLKMVSQLGVYRGFIDNYENAVEIVRKCMHTDPRFRTLAQSMTSTNGGDKTRTTYTFQTLLYKPLDRVTKTTLVLHDLLKTTPEEHMDHSVLQEALRLSQSFLSGVNETSHCRREVTLTHGMRRKLMRDGFVVDVCEGERHLRHLFLYTDLLLCVKLKVGTKGKQAQYRFCWYMPLAALRTHWAPKLERSANAHLRLHAMRAKMFLLKHEQSHTGASRGLVYRTLERGKKKLEQMELLLLTHSPVHQLELHSPSGKSHTVLLSSLHELEEWREAIDKLTRDNVETVPPDLLTLTSSCVKLRMTQQPPLQSLNTDESHCLRGTLSSECDSGGQENVLGRTSVKLEPTVLQNRWRTQSLSLGQVQVTLSLKYCPHALDPPGRLPAQQQAVFSVPIGVVAQQEGVQVPHVVRCCVQEVERRGLKELGIYRVSGVACDISSLRADFNASFREAAVKLRCVDVNAVSCLLKLYFRELPEPLIPTELFQSLARAVGEPPCK